MSTHSLWIGWALEVGSLFHLGADEPGLESCLCHFLGVDPGWLSVPQFPPL